MKKPISVLNNENGVALITAIMVLIILTIIGLASTYTSDMERDVASGETAYKMGFYMADAGISYARGLTEKDLPSTLAAPADITPSTTPPRPYTLTYYETSVDQDGDRRFVVQSTTNDPTGAAGTVMIEAEILFPTAQKGKELGDGNETGY